MAARRWAKWGNQAAWQRGDEPSGRGRGGRERAPSGGPSSTRGLSAAGSAHPLAVIHRRRRRRRRPCAPSPPGALAPCHGRSGL
eukprot:6379340-Prymnesium_polylepis.1